MKEVNDRGTIKWTSLMLPEHVSMLEELYAEQERKEMPVLDEAQIGDIGNDLEHSLIEGKKITVTHFRDYEFHEIIGVVSNIDMQLKRIRIEDDYISFNTIVKTDL